MQTSLLYAQLHSAAASDGTLNIVGDGRKAINWTVPAEGGFGLASPITFSGGASFGAVYSVTLWNAETDGDMLGEILLSNGDLTFNGNGEYQVTAIDFALVASDV